MVNFNRKHLPFVRTTSPPGDRGLESPDYVSDDSLNSDGHHQPVPSAVASTPNNRPTPAAATNIKAPKSPRPENFTKNHARGARQKRRIENNNFLLNLVNECDDLDEIRFDDFVSKSTTAAFSQLFMANDKMKAWNDFASRSEDEQDRILKHLDDERDRNNSEKKNKQEKQQQECGIAPVTQSKASTSTDSRVEHPAYTTRPQLCFDKIEVKLRSSLKKKHLPIGAMEFIEMDVRSWFTRHPVKMYKKNLRSSFDRLLMHAVCQYMDLLCYSQSVRGCRQTFAVNSNNRLIFPALPLYQFLQRNS